MVTLNAEEQAIVQKKKKSDAELPKYYDASLRKEVPITRDFEAFLILAPDELKTNALTWIKKVQTLQTIKKDRDDLMALMIANEISNATLKLDTLEDKMDGYNQFRSKFQTLTDFSAVIEVQNFLKDLQQVLPELSMERNRAFYDQTVAVIEDAENIRKGTINEENLTQLQSWATVISTYF